MTIKGQNIMGTPKTVLGFNGELFEPTTGHSLLGNGYRAYSSLLMIFIQPDSWSPFGAGGLNAYAYCKGDPVNLADRTGHKPVFTGMWHRRSPLSAPDVGRARSLSPVEPINLAMRSEAPHVQASGLLEPQAQVPNTAAQLLSRHSPLNGPPGLASRPPKPSPVSSRSSRPAVSKKREREQALKRAVQSLDTNEFLKLANRPGDKSMALRSLDRYLPLRETRKDVNGGFVGGDLNRVRRYALGSTQEVRNPKLVRFLDDIEDLVLSQYHGRPGGKR